MIHIREEEMDRGVAHLFEEAMALAEGEMGTGLVNQHCSC